MTKPFNTAELLARVDTHLKLRQARKELERRADEIARIKREHEAFLRYELKNRITPIMGYSELLLFDGEDLSPRHRGWISMIHDGAENMVGYVDAVKQLQDLEADDFKLKKCRVALSSLVKQVIADLDAVYGDRTTVRYEDCLEDDAVLVDANLLRGVFQNLIKNAMEHVMELADEAQRAVTVNLGSGNGQVLVEIRNGGEPIPPEKVASFFDKFNTSKKGKGGTGLGTTYARLVTRAHGGEISVTSSEAEGTTVTVRLPKAS